MPHDNHFTRDEIRAQRWRNEIVYLVSTINIFGVNSAQGVKAVDNLGKLGLIDLGMAQHVAGMSLNEIMANGHLMQLARHWIKE
jgi:hypothetical protein